MDQSLFTLGVKGFGRGALLPSPTGRAIAAAGWLFFNHACEETLPHAAVACETGQIMASLVAESFRWRGLHEARHCGFCRRFGAVFGGFGTDGPCCG
jgi:hypothetical protein